jgi:hypothetical protein
MFLVLPPLLSHSTLYDPTFKPLWPPLKIPPCFQMRTMLAMTDTMMSTCDSRPPERISYYSFRMYHDTQYVHLFLNQPGVLRLMYE